MFIRKLFFCFLLLAFAPLALSETTEIKLLVNGKPISNFDIEQQMQMLLITSNITPTKANRAQARERAKAQLIDNILRTDIAEQNNIRASDEEVTKAIQRGLQQGAKAKDFLNYLNKNKVLPENFLRHMKSEVLWNKYVQREILPRISVPQSQIQEEIEKIKQSLQQKTFLLSQIVLHFNNAAEEKKVRTLAAQLKQQLNGGADFASLARNYSHGRKATQGGNLGWTAASALPAKLRRVVAKMKQGAISPVLRLADGYYLLRLQGTQKASQERMETMMLDLKLVRLPSKVSFQQIQNKMPACPQATTYLQEQGGEVESLGLMSLHDLAPALQKKVATAKKNSLILSFRDKTQQELILVCDKSARTNPKLSESKIENQLLSEQAFVRARQKLRELRQHAAIENK